MNPLAAVGRDYRLTGPEGIRAVERGLADAAWWRPPIDDDRLSELMARTNARAARDTIIWLGLIVGLGVAMVATWWSWWSIPIIFAYAALYGGAADSRWHECGHGTAFAASWPNTAVYYLASFMLWREATVWRWTHYRHHTDTIIVGRDAEIAFQRPPQVSSLPMVYLHWINGPKMLARVMRDARSVTRLDPETVAVVPESEHRAVVAENRVYLAILAATVVAAVALRSALPVFLIGLPTILGGWLVVFFGITQHAGLQEDVLDHRLNTRTVYMNPLFRFLYSNMNYHIEHHLFPGVPYRSLPALHDEIKDYLPPPCPNVAAAYRELLGALRLQERDPYWEIPNRDIPDVPSAQLKPVQVGPIVDDATAQRFDAAVLTDAAAKDGLGLSETRVSIASVRSVPVGTVKRVDLGENTYAVCRLAADEVVVTDGLCTHGHAYLAEGHLNGGVIECPKHNGRFDVRTGAAVRKPVREPLRVFETFIDGDRIIVDFDLVRGECAPDHERTRSNQ